MATDFPLKSPRKEFGEQASAEHFPLQSEYLKISSPFLMLNRASHETSSKSLSSSSSACSLSTPAKAFGPQDSLSSGGVQRRFLSKAMKQRRLFTRGGRDIDDDQSSGSGSQSTPRRFSRFMRWRRNGSSSSFSEDCFDDAEADVNLSLVG
jgi:hypothetical protein